MHALCTLNQTPLTKRHYYTQHAARKVHTAQYVRSEKKERCSRLRPDLNPVSTNRRLLYSDPRTLYQVSHNYGQQTKHYQKCKILIPAGSQHHGSWGGTAHHWERHRISAKHRKDSCPGSKSCGRAQNCLSGSVCRRPRGYLERDSATRNLDLRPGGQATRRLQRSTNARLLKCECYAMARLLKCCIIN
jgi:hypothetical protein